MEKILITGINGFVGSHLAEFIVNNNLGEVFGTSRGKTPSYDNLSNVIDKVKIIDCDITDFHSVSRAVEEVQPERIFHLAAQAYVPFSWRGPTETINTNIIGSMNLFEAIRKSNLNPVMQIAGSSEEYGLVHKDEAPINELNPLRPLSPYGVSKVAMDLMGYQYFKSYGLKIIRTRAFNHTGPRRGQNYVTSNWCKQISLIEAGKQEPKIFVGNLESYRDFTDVRDMVKAYWLATEKGDAGEVYNISSDKAIKMKDMIELIISKSSVKPKIVQDASRMRPSDVELLLGNSTKFREKTGWKPEISFDKTIDDLLSYWREKVK
jgi:GDP-4-dehydro-6-deoxy-D-mannose reductase